MSNDVYNGQIKPEFISEVVIEASFAHAGFFEDIIKGCILKSSHGKLVNSCFFQAGVTQQWISFTYKSMVVEITFFQ